MTVELKKGSLKKIFASARETAKEIDEGQRLTPKKSIWVEPSDLMLILKPERTKLVQYLRKKRTVNYSELLSAMNRTPVSLNNDLKILSKYQLIKILRKPNPGHGMHKVIETIFGNEEIEFKTVI